MIVKQSEGREPIATGAYHAVCCALVDLGTQPSGNPKYKPRQKVLVIWELVDERVEYEKDGEKRSFMQTISREFSMSLGGGNKPTEFRKLLESWRGRPFTAEELDGFELKNVLGVNGLLTVVHGEGTNGTMYANVGSVSPLMKGTQKRESETPHVYFTMSDIPEGGRLVWPEGMRDWIKNRIRKSAEYILRFEGTESGGHDDGAPPHEDDDIPF